MFHRYILLVVMARKRKFNFVELSNMLGGYTSFYRTTCRGVKGYAYRVGRKLTEEEKKLILSYDNTSVGSFYYRYAPELSYDGVFIGDKCF